MTPPKIYGLIGYPVKHSLSPAMHNAAFKELKINAEYQLFSLKEEEIPVFMRQLNNSNIYGLNVTIPYKEKAISFLDNISNEAKLIGAVNTIKVTPRLLSSPYKGEGIFLEGFNTDGAGFLKHLSEDLGFSSQGKNIAVIGAGGAARSITVYLSTAKAKNIYIFDIDKPKLTGLVSHLKNNFKDVCFEQVDSLGCIPVKDLNLLVNATPIGMKDSDSLPIDANLLKENKDLFVYDIVYNRETQLIKYAKSIGLSAVNGLGMLLYQGVLAFEIWTGKTAPVDIMRKALIEGLKKITK